jgi:hypothetical protein
MANSVEKLDLKHGVDGGAIGKLGFRSCGHHAGGG